MLRCLQDISVMICMVHGGDDESDCNGENGDSANYGSGVDDDGDNDDYRES